MRRTIRFRALRREDAELTWKWRNETVTRQMYAGHPFFVNPEKERAWYDRILTSDYPNVTMGIEIEETEKLIGLMFLMHVNHINRSAELAFLFDKESRKATDIMSALHLALHFGFYELNLHRIYGKTIEQHEMLIKLYERYGALREGLLRQSVFKNGKYVNEVLLAILKEDYENHERNKSHIIPRADKIK
jgi:RimJ/RimL family protein N-acetyltransferase